MFQRFWLDEHGSIVCTELVLVSSLLVAGMVTSLTQMRNVIVGEISDVSAAIGSLDQSYSYGGVEADNAFTAGAAFEDGPQCTAVLCSVSK